VILVLESVIRGGWSAMSGGGSWSQSTDGGEGSMGFVQIPVTYLCDHSFSRSIAACASGEDCVPVEVRSVSHSVMNSEMTGCRYRVVVFPICVSLMLVTSSTSLSSGNPVCDVVIHIGWSFVVCWSVMAFRNSLGLRMTVSAHGCLSNWSFTHNKLLR
jgi:hypothetical protein